MKKLFCVLMFFVFLAGNALGAVKGACVTCHTMHNSQDGVSVTVSSNPVEALLSESSCFACHTGVNTGLDAGIMNGNGIPYVFSTIAVYDTDTLAGGNFKWVQSDDAKGHNVDGVVAVDGTLTKPPGWDETYSLNGVLNSGNAVWTNPLTCAGTNGCHGDHSKTNDFESVRGAHHLVDAVIDGSTVGNSYRFLIGIEGKEDNDWEFTKSSTDHNQYKGSSDLVDGSTISYLCSECHGQYHTAENSNGEDGSAPWLRHPTDLDMNVLDAGTEYKSYTVYDPMVPVASVDVSGVKSDIMFGGDAIVTCISCHRAHGSPNDDLLRWDYSGMVSGNGATNGCFVCHTTKN